MEMNINLPTRYYFDHFLGMKEILDTMKRIRADSISLVIMRVIKAEENKFSKNLFYMSSNGRRVMGVSLVLM